MPKRSYRTDRGSTIKKSTLQSLKREVKVTFSNNFFVKSHNIHCSDKIKNEIGRQFAKQAPTLREFKSGFTDSKDQRSPRFIKMKDQDCVNDIGNIELDAKEKIDF